MSGSERNFEAGTSPDQVYAAENCTQTFPERARALQATLWTASAACSSVGVCLHNPLWYWCMPWALLGTMKTATKRGLGVGIPGCCI